MSSLLFCFSLPWQWQDLFHNVVSKCLTFRKTNLKKKKSMHIECLALHICLPFRLKKRNNNLCKKLSIFLKNGVASTIFSNSQPFVEKLSRNSLLCKQYRCLVFNSLFLKTCFSWFEKHSLRNCHWFSKMYSYKTRGWVKKFPRSIFIQLAERQEKIK